MLGEVGQETSLSETVGQETSLIVSQSGELPPSSGRRSGDLPHRETVGQETSSIVSLSLFAHSFSSSWQISHKPISSTNSPQRGQRGADVRCWRQP